MRKEKKISFVFDIILLIIAIVSGIILLVANFFNPFLHQYVFIGIIVLEALCFATIIAISILVRKTNREREKFDDDWKSVIYRQIKN